MIGLLLDMNVGRIEEKGAFEDLIGNADDRCVASDVSQAFCVVQPGCGRRPGAVLGAALQVPARCLDATPGAQGQGSELDVGAQGEPQGLDRRFVAGVHEPDDEAGAAAFVDFIPGHGDGVAILQEARAQAWRIHERYRNIVGPDGRLVKIGAGRRNAVFRRQPQQAERDRQGLAGAAAGPYGAIQRAGGQAQGVRQCRARMRNGR